MEIAKIKTLEIRVSVLEIDMQWMPYSFFDQIPKIYWADLFADEGFELIGKIHKNDTWTILARKDGQLWVSEVTSLFTENASREKILKGLTHIFLMG
jgi:hypothetical protein